MFNTPVLFLIFNRPDTTQLVFEKIREIQPKQLFIAADGPRMDKPGEAEICLETRNWVLQHIDWDCEVKTRFNEINLGCGKNVSGAITWFFDNVEEGIILEDDCVPSINFFSFCECLLEKYRYHENVFMIGGTNHQKKKRGNASYYFSAYGHIWGWATWRKAWRKYSYFLDVIDDDTIKKDLLYYFKTKPEIEYWYSTFKMMKENPIDTWDYQWYITLFHNKARNIIPNVNLVTNIGFTLDATHTKCFIEGISNKPVKSLGKITHPKKIIINRKADLYTFYNTDLMHHRKPSRKSIFYHWEYVKNRMIRILSKMLSDFKLYRLTKLGISWRELKKLEKNKTKGFSVLFGKKIQITDSFWHLFGLREIFIDETYRFSSVNEHPYIIDCGANIGLSVIYFKRNFPKAIIDCFEPDALIFKKLQHNVNQFNAENVTFHQKAVWMDDKEISFVSDGSVGGHIGEVKPGESNSIPAVRLKSFLDKKVDFLKLDIEGAEFEVLQDCADKLCNVENIFVEYHSCHEKEQMIGELLIILKNAGFKVYIKEAWENMKLPFIEKKGPFYDLQLNIFGYRR